MPSSLKLKEPPRASAEGPLSESIERAFSSEGWKILELVDLIHRCSENSTTVVSRPVVDMHEHNHAPMQPIDPLPAPRRWTRLSLADRARVVERYEAGEASTSLAAELGVAKSTILAILREANVVVRRQPLTPQQVSEAAALYGSGCSMSQVAARMSHKQDTIRLALKAVGVRMRPPTGH